MREANYSTGYDYRAVMSHLRAVYHGEGGAIYFGETDPSFCIISDEGSLADFLDDDEGLICVREFASDAARTKWCRDTYPHVTVE